MNKSANGVTGHLLYMCDGVYVFRVYDRTTPQPTFIDYDLLHCDLVVTIQDADAAFYSEQGRNTLDHAPGTLGITAPNQLDGS